MATIGPGGIAPVRRSFAGRFAQAAAVQAQVAVPAVAVAVPVQAQAGVGAPLLGRVDPAPVVVAPVRRSLAGRFSQAAAVQAAPVPGLVVPVAPPPRPAVPSRFAARFLTARPATATAAPTIRPPAGLEATLITAADDESRTWLENRRPAVVPPDEGSPPGTPSTLSYNNLAPATYVQSLIQAHLLRFNAAGQRPIKEMFNTLATRYSAPLAAHETARAAARTAFDVALPAARAAAVDRGEDPDGIEFVFQDPPASDFQFNNGGYDLIGKLIVEETMSSGVDWVQQGMKRNYPRFLHPHRDEINALRARFAGLSAANQTLVRVRLHHPGADLDALAQPVLVEARRMAGLLAAEGDDGIRRETVLEAVVGYFAEHPVGRVEQVIIQAPVAPVVVVARPPGPPFPLVEADTEVLINEAALARHPTPINFEQIRRDIEAAERQSGVISFDELLTQFDQVEDREQRRQINVRRAAAEQALRDRIATLTEARRQAIQVYQTGIDTAIDRRNAAAPGSQAYKDAVRDMDAAIRGRDGIFHQAGCMDLQTAINRINGGNEFVVPRTPADPRVLLSGYVDYMKRQILRSGYGGGAAGQERYRRNHFDELTLFIKGGIVSLRNPAIPNEKKLAALRVLMQSGYDPLGGSQGNCDPGKKESGEDFFKTLQPNGDDVEQIFLKLIEKHKRALFVAIDTGGHTANMLAYVTTRVGNRIGTPPTSGEIADPYRNSFPPSERITAHRSRDHDSEEDLMALFDRLYTQRPEDVVFAVHSGPSTEGGIAAEMAEDREKIARKIDQLLAEAVQANSITIEEAQRRCALYYTLSDNVSPTGAREFTITQAGTKFLLSRFGVTRLIVPPPAVVVDFGAFRNAFEVSRQRVIDAGFTGILPVPAAIPEPDEERLPLDPNDLTIDEGLLAYSIAVNGDWMAYEANRHRIDTVTAINAERTDAVDSIRYQRALLETVLARLAGEQRAAFVNMIRPVVNNPLLGQSHGFFEQQARLAIITCMTTAQEPLTALRNMPPVVNTMQLRNRLRALCQSYQGLTLPQQGEVLAQVHTDVAPLDAQARAVWTECRDYAGLFIDRADFVTAIRAAATNLNIA